MARHHESVRLLDAAGTVPRLAALPGAGAVASEDADGLAAWRGGGAGLGLRHSARLSQIGFGFDESARREDLFPAGAVDADLQQVDLREINSWRLKLSEVGAPEMIEVQLVNAVAPFILCARLKPLMLRAPGRDKHVVNVSAMEGIFSRGTKTDRHPHTNMAKGGAQHADADVGARLRDGRDPHERRRHRLDHRRGPVRPRHPQEEELGFEPPLDIVDGAARVLDPYLAGLNTGEHAWRSSSRTTSRPTGGRAPREHTAYGVARHRASSCTGTGGSASAPGLRRAASSAVAVRDANGGRARAGGVRG